MHDQGTGKVDPEGMFRRNSWCKRKGLPDHASIKLVHSIHLLPHKCRMEQLGLETRPPLLLSSFLPVKAYQDLISM